MLSDVKDLAKKWDNLRRSHRRFLTKINHKKSGAGNEDDCIDTEDDCNGALWEIMAFLIPYIKIQPTLNNMVWFLFRFKKFSEHK